MSLTEFDPNAAGTKGSMFGLRFSPEEASIVVIPVPWEATVSYRAGTSEGPQAILDASIQIDLFHPLIKDAWRLGIAMLPIPKDIKNLSQKLHSRKNSHLELSGAEGFNDDLISEINVASASVNKWVLDQARYWRAKDKVAVTLGGEHSTPFGLLQCLAEDQSFGILQIDAHMDLRSAYEGFEHSHASIMHNALKLNDIVKLVQVGIRDYCEEEYELSEEDDRVSVFYDTDIQTKKFEGVLWSDQCTKIIQNLPKQVYVSFDIDGLQPSLCPGTGTPVPGGLSFNEAIYLIKAIVMSGRKIIGFDLSEVAPKDNDGEWNANVGARILYQLACLTGVSQGRLKVS